MTVAMWPNQRIRFEGIDLSDLAFWAQPLAALDGAFKTVRAQRPFGYFNEPQPTGTTTVDDVQRFAAGRRAIVADHHERETS